MLDEGANRLKVQYLHGSMEVDAAGISGKVSAHYPGRSVLKSGQKSAEGIVSPVFLAGTKART